MGNELPIQTVEFEIDKTKPIIKLFDVSGDVAYSNGRIPQIKVIESTEYEIKITLDGMPISRDYFIESEGKYRLAYHVTDRAGNSDTNEISITIDQSKPRLMINGVENGQYYRTPKMFSISIEEENLRDSSFLLNNSICESEMWIHDDGAYVITMKAIDLAGNAAHRELTFYIDRKIPDIQISGIDNNKIYNHPVVPFININESNLATETISLNGTTYSQGDYIEDDGNYALAIEAIDHAGNSSKRQLYFVVDRTPPHISIDGVADGMYYRSQVKPDIIATDNDIKNLEILINGVSFTKGEVLSKDGDYLLEVKSIDFAGNQANKRIEFTIDSVKPVIKITNINPSDILKVNVTPEIHIEERNNAKVITLLNNKEYRQGQTITENGQYILKILCIDKAGNQAEKSISFSIDKSKPPDIYITGLSDQSVYNYSIMPDIIVANNIPQENVETKLNDNPFKSGTRISEEGKYILEVTVKDMLAIINSKKIEFAIDRTKPKIQISGLQNKKFYNTSVKPKIMVEDENPNESVIRLNNETYHSETEISNDGNYLLTVFASDRAGNKSEKSIEFTIDKMKPEIDVEGINDGNHYNSARLPLVNVHERYLADKNIILNQSEYIPGTFISSEGKYKLLVTAEDLAGNLSRETINFTIDRNPPHVNITGVSHETHYNRDVKAEVFIIEENLIFKKILLNDSIYESNSIISEEGMYQLSINAIDKAGNETNKEITFNIDKSSPQIIIGKVTDGQILSSGTTPDIEIVDRNIKDIKILLNNREYKQGETITEEGHYELKVECRDKAGNQAEKSISFSIDKSKPPDIYITGLSDQSEYNYDIVPEIFVPNNIRQENVAIKLNDSPFKSGTRISKDGKYILEVTVKDMLAIINSKKIEFAIDKTKPKIQISGVQNKRFYNTSVKPKIMVEDENPNESVIRLNNETYHSETEISNDGNYLLTVFASDRAGNKSEKSIEFTIDKMKPEIDVEGINDGNHYNSARLPLVNVHERYLADKNIILNQSEYIPGTLISSEGKYKLLVTAEDLAGNLSRETINFTIDRNLPHINITGVSHETHYNRDVKAEVFIIEENLIFKKILLNDSIYESNSIISEEGMYQLSINAMDKAGNEVITEITFNIDKSSPQIIIGKVTDGQILSSGITPDIEIVDRNIKDIKILLNNREYKQGETITEEGHYELKVECRDKAGNQAEKSISFYICNPNIRSDVRIIDDFEPGLCSNKLSYGEKHIFEQSPSSASYIIGIERIEYKKSDVLILDFDKRNEGGPYGHGGWCGYYAKLADEDHYYFDATDYTFISFWVRGARGDENFLIGLADENWDKKDDAVKSQKITSYTDKQTLGTKWRKVKIPLSDFAIKLSKLVKFVIILDSSCFPDKASSGRVFIDQIMFEK